MSEKEFRNRASTADKIALGIGTAAALGVAAGIYIAKKSAASVRRFALGRGSVPKEYWQADYVKDSVPQTRYFHGTLDAVNRRLKHYQAEVTSITRLDKAEVDSLIAQHYTHLIEL